VADPKFCDHLLPELANTTYFLPLVSQPQIPSQAFGSIDGTTLQSLMDNIEHFSRRFCIIDCRFPYEYHGGHIRTAINLFQKKKLENIFFPSNFASLERMKKIIPIFYCEFSQKRAPSMAQHLRFLDRKRNENRYPYVDYPELYVLDRGYQKLFTVDGLTELCYPAAYIPMLEKEHVSDLRRLSRVLSCNMTSTKSRHRFSSIFGARKNNVRSPTKNIPTTKNAIRLQLAASE